MKLLLVADEESPYLWDYYQPGRLNGIDCILSCGDLKQEYLEFLVTMSGRPLYYVHGNHDKGYVDFPPRAANARMMSSSISKASACLAWAAASDTIPAPTSTPKKKCKSA